VNESKTIGYGNPGDIPWQFTLGKEEEQDVGYLKLFFSDRYVDLLHLKRPGMFRLKRELRSVTRGMVSGANRQEEMHVDHAIEPITASTHVIEALNIPVFQQKDLGV
jgi:hypothetical protein